MTESGAPMLRASLPPISELPPTPNSHFALWFYAAVLDVIASIVRVEGSQESAVARFPFLGAYCAEIAGAGAVIKEADDASMRWQKAVAEWESGAAAHLPLRAVRAAAGLGASALRLLICVGLPEEDVRFGHLFADLQGTPGQHRPTA